MAEDRGTVTNELLFEALKAIQAKLSDHDRQFEEIKERLSLVETGVGALHAQYASLSGRIDAIDARCRRIETRLDLTEA